MFVMDPQQAKTLLEKYREGRSTPEEAALVEQWYQQLGDSGEWQWEAGEKETLQAIIENRLLQQIRGTTKVVPLYKRWWAAAAIIIILATAGYFILSPAKTNQPPIVKTNVPGNNVEAPKITKAMITLANGEQVLLDSLTSMEQGNVAIQKTSDGQVIYNGTNDQVEYNTLFNPRGSKVQPLTLNDGTKVWLNAASSITYPTAFTGKQRKVEISGEAYFEVAHDAGKPFYVSKGTMTVQVLGTHFNVNAYDDEAQLKVTLLEGSVKVLRGDQEDKAVIIKPGQQASIGKEIKVLSNVNVEEVMAWKNGLFSMHSADIGTIMRQIGRWYDVEVLYENGVPSGTISGEVPRTFSLSEVLKVYEYSGVKFRIEDKKVTVIK